MLNTSRLECCVETSASDCSHLSCLLFSLGNLFSEEFFLLLDAVYLHKCSSGDPRGKKKKKIPEKPAAFHCFLEFNILLLSCFSISYYTSITSSGGCRLIHLYTVMLLFPPCILQRNKALILDISRPMNTPTTQSSAP